MLEMYEETKEKITFKLEGENELDVKNFGEMLLNVENILRKINVTTNKKNALEVKIIAIKEGSFEFDLMTFLGILPELFQNAVSAYELTKAFLEWIKLKDWLKGEKVEKIEIVNNGEKVNITKVDGTGHTINNTINCNIFTGQNKVEEIDKLYRNLGKFLPKDRNLILKTKEGIYSHSNKVKENLEAPIQIQETEEEKKETNLVTRVVVIKKVDFTMNSKWQFKIGGKVYEVPILDEEFKNYVISGNFFAHNGTELKVDLEEAITYNSKGEALDISFSILKVYPIEDSSYKLV